MAELTNPLTHKVGPLPAIAWAGIAGGVYLVYRYSKAKQATAATNTAVAALPNGNPDVGSATDFSNGYGNAASTGYSTTSLSTTNLDGSPLTNTDWGKQATNYLIALGIDPQDASTAISSYLYGTGQALNTTQTGALNTVLQHFGVPPEGVIIPPPTTGGAVATTPTTTTDNSPQVTQLGLAYSQAIASGDYAAAQAAQSQAASYGMPLMGTNPLLWGNQAPMMG